MNSRLAVSALLSLAIWVAPAAARPMLTSIDITLSATVTSVTGGGSFLYPGPPDDEGGHPDIRRDFTVQEIPGFFYQPGDKLNVRWIIDAAALQEAYGPDYQETGETFFANPIQLCGQNTSSWHETDCDSRAGLRADDLSFAGRRLFTAGEIFDVSESPEALGPIVDLTSFEIDPMYLVSALWSRTCCRYFFDTGADSFFSTEGFVPDVDATATSFAKGLIDGDDGLFSLRFPILRPGLAERDLFDDPFGVFEANIAFDAEWTIVTTSVPEPGPTGLLVLGLLALAVGRNVFATAGLPRPIS